MSRRNVLLQAVKAAGTSAVLPRLAAALPASAAHNDAAGLSDREQWLVYVERVSHPVLYALSRRELRKTMPVEAAQGLVKERAVGTHLEALGRLLAGLAPWLELEPQTGESPAETKLRTQYRAWAQQAIASAVDPASPDLMRFGESSQTLVDSSFLSLALLRAPKQLCESMDSVTRTRLVSALESERRIQSPYNNWLLFAALNEALLRRLGVFWDRVRVDYALRSLHSWYAGDGNYSDGPVYHADYYNSYVMHPYLLALMDAVGEEAGWKEMQPHIVERATRYAAIQERSISPGGEYPVLGRSITYRGGAFHALAEVARRGSLASGIMPQQVRCALTAVQQRTLSAAGTFSASGWLQIGLAGHQPDLGETYISTGSLYLCSALWLPLGLPSAHPFWAGAAVDWTQKSLWAGHNGFADHAISS